MSFAFFRIFAVIGDPRNPPALLGHRWCGFHIDRDTDLVVWRRVAGQTCKVIVAAIITGTTNCTIVRTKNQSVFPSIVAYSRDP